MTELRALLKLFWVVLKVRLGWKPENTRLDVSTEEADVLMKLAAENGWRALLVKLQTAKVEEAICPQNH